MSYHDRTYHETFKKDDRNLIATRLAEPSKRHNKLQALQRDIKKKKRQQNNEVNLLPEEEYLILKGGKQEKVSTRKPSSEVKELKKKKEAIKQEIREERVRKFNKKISKV